MGRLDHIEHRLTQIRHIPGLQRVPGDNLDSPLSRLNIGIAESCDVCAMAEMNDEAMSC